MALDKIILEAKVEECAKKCAEYSEQNGTENPDLLYEYGKALFAVAKQNSSLVDSQKMEEKQLPIENPKVKIANFEEIDEDGDVEEETVAVESADQDKQEADAGASDAKQAEEPATNEEAKEEEKEEEEEEDEDDFVVAFQIIDLARVLYEKQTPKTEELNIKLARTRELLGDISLEDDNATQAVEDYAAAVELKRQIHGPDSGEVSEAEFMLSLAYDAAGNQARAVDHLKRAAAAAEAAKLPSANELAQRAKDAEQDLKATAKLEGQDIQQAKEVTKESISGRSAIANAVQSLVSNANDISQLARKRKRDDSKESSPAIKKSL